MQLFRYDFSQLPQTAPTGKWTHDLLVTSLTAYSLSQRSTLGRCCRNQTLAGGLWSVWYHLIYWLTLQYNVVLIVRLKPLLFDKSSIKMCQNTLKSQQKCEKNWGNCHVPCSTMTSYVPCSTIFLPLCSMFHYLFYPMFHVPLFFWPHVPCSTILCHPPQYNIT